MRVSDDSEACFQATKQRNRNPRILSVERVEAGALVTYTDITGREYIDLFTDINYLDEWLFDFDLMRYELIG